MFTNQKGERIVRVINYRFYVTDKLEMIHAGADYLAFSNVELNYYYSIYLENSLMIFINFSLLKFWINALPI
jgi:hypothetical protein